MDENGQRKVITLICPNLRCRSLLQVPETVRGQKVRCSRCGKNFIVPLPATPQPGPSASVPSTPK